MLHLDASPNDRVHRDKIVSHKVSYVGLEYGFAPNWTAGIEYDYLFRESDSRTLLTPSLAVASVTANTRTDISMLTGRISYKFGGYGPSIAKY